jgi:hypothetical protein
MKQKDFINFLRIPLAIISCSIGIIGAILAICCAPIEVRIWLNGVWFGFLVINLTALWFVERGNKNV